MADPTDTIVSDCLVLKASNSSNVESLAARIAHGVYDDELVAVRAIGAGAVNQATKACAIATSMAEDRGYDVSYVLGFDTVVFHDADGDKEWSAMTFRPVLDALD